MTPELFTGGRFTIIAGPCVAESKDLCIEVASVLREETAKRGLALIFKASFDKANRTSVDSYRGPGIEAGLATLEEVRRALGVPVLTDVHDAAQVRRAAQVVDVLQIPAFLCRQTDLLLAAAATGLCINIKKGQFLAPEDLRHAVHKVQKAGGGPVAVTERGTTFGYHNLVVDMRGLHVMRERCLVPIVFDATHSVQRPASEGQSTGGDRRYAALLSRAAVAVGVDGVFCEVHPDPDRALSDGPNSLSFPLLRRMLDEIVVLQEARAKLAPFAESF